MKTDKLTGCILSIPLILLVIIIILRSCSLITQAKLWLSIALLFLLVMPFLLTQITKFSSWIKEYALKSFIRHYILIYFGFILAVLAVSRDILPVDASWLDTNLFALGIAAIGLGLALLPKELRELEVTQEQEESEADDLKGKLEKLDKRFSEMENIISSTFIELDEKLKKIQKKKDKQ